MVMLVRVMREVAQQGRNGAANVFLGHIYWEALEYDNTIWGPSKVWRTASTSIMR